MIVGVEATGRATEATAGGARPTDPGHITLHVALPTSDYKRLCLAFHSPDTSYVLTAIFDISDTPAGSWVLAVGIDGQLMADGLVPDARLSDRCDDLLDAPRVLAAWSASALLSERFKIYLNAQGHEAELRFLESAAGNDGSVRAFACTSIELPSNGSVLDTECIVDRTAPLRFDGGWALLSERGAPVSRTAFDVRLARRE